MALIKVIIVKQKDREHYIARWTDPISGRRKYETTGETKESKALTYAAKLEERLNSGTYVADAGVNWEDFRKRYTEEHLAGLSEKGAYKAENVLDGFHDVISVKNLSTVTSIRINHYVAKLRGKGRTEATIKGNLAYIKAALNWAHEMGMIASVPKIKPPKRARKSKMMKGRPITKEEFERIVKCISKVIDEDHVDQWKLFLEGLWWSGLRIGEAIELKWHEGPFCVIEMGKHFYFRIQAEAEKGNQDRITPMAPEFEQLLRKVKNQKGRVFQPVTKWTRGVIPRIDTTGRLVKRIATKANVISDTDKGSYATAHDLRRSFGERWAQLILPQQLMELMRHTDIKTTLAYYVGKNAKTTTNALWDAFSKAKSLQDGLHPPEDKKQEQGSESQADTQ